MTIQRMNILKMLYEGRSQGYSSNTIETLLERMAVSWDDIQYDVAYLEENGYLEMKRRQVGTRIFVTLYITARGIDLIEKSAIEPAHASNTGYRIVQDTTEETIRHKINEDVDFPNNIAQDREPKLAVYISYAPEDDSLRNELEKHLVILKQQGLISPWNNHQITAGMDWKREIKEQLDKAQIILPLVSPDFLASKYYRDIEMTRAIERHKLGEANIVPVLLRPTADWKHSVFGELQVLPRNELPVTMWPSLDQAFTEVAKGIREVVEKLTTTL